MTSSDRQLLERAAREAFEADYFGTFSDCPAIERDGDGYKAAHVQSAWGIWQAAWTASRQKALQEAAKIAERVVGNRKEDASRNDGRQSDFAFGAVGAADSIASAIRSLGGITSNEGERG